MKPEEKRLSVQVFQPEAGRPRYMIDGLHGIEFHIMYCGSGGGMIYSPDEAKEDAEYMVASWNAYRKQTDALRKIANWTDFPSTGKFWPGGVVPVSYETEHGSNGARDYMRQVALDALAGNRLPIMRIPEFLLKALKTARGFVKATSEKTGFGQVHTLREIDHALRNAGIDPEPITDVKVPSIREQAELAHINDKNHTAFGTRDYAANPVKSVDEYEAELNKSPLMRVEWAEAQRICDDPAVDEAIRNLLEDRTNDNATCMVRQIIALARYPNEGT